MANFILGIHGLANKTDKPILASWWEAAIREGLANIGSPNADFQFIMVYWADLMYKYALHQDTDFDHDSLYNDQPYREAQPGALRKYDEGWRDAVREAITTGGGAVLDTIRGYVGLDAASDWLIEQKLKDLHYYYDENRRITNRQGTRRQAREVLMVELMNSLLPLTGESIMLIGHSMGSIIAYDVLRDLGRRDNAFDIAHFITIGSPLGIPHVKDHVYEERSRYDSAVPVRTPSVVSVEWVNYADRKDPVAVDAHLRDDYKANARGIRVEDDLVINDYVTDDGESRPHKSYGYLRTPELSEHIRRFLT